MKGVVFTEFLEMVEKEFGYEIVDKIIAESNLPSEGIYTAVGTYDHAEIISLITNLSKATEKEIAVLLKAFGQYIFDTFLNGYPAFFNTLNHAFDFLESIDKHIHVEVLKLYPDAAFPKFNTVIDGDKMKMTYLSERKMSDFAEGLIERTMTHYGHDYEMSKILIEEDGSVVEFNIQINEG